MDDNFYLKDFVLVKIPNPLPPPFSNFNPDWQKGVKKLDGQTVVLNYRQADGQYSGRGYCVKSGVPGDNFVSWLPEIWLEKIPRLKFKAGDLVRVSCLTGGRTPCHLDKKIGKISGIDSLNPYPYVIEGLLHSELELSFPKIEVGDRVRVLHSGAILEVLEVTSSAACVTSHYWNPLANLELVSYDTPVFSSTASNTSESGVGTSSDNQGMALSILKEELSVLRSERDQFRIKSEKLSSQNIDFDYKWKTEIVNKKALSDLLQDASKTIKDLEGQLTLTQAEVERLKNPRKNPQISQISLVSRLIRPQIYLEQINAQNPDQFDNPFMGGGLILIKMMLLPFLCLFKLGKFGADQVKKLSYRVVEGYRRLLSEGKELRTYINTFDPGAMLVMVISTIIMSFYMDIIYFSRVRWNEEDKAAAVVGPQHIPSPSDPREAALIEKRAAQKAAQIKKDWK